jgi:hypothetical protein
MVDLPSCRISATWLDVNAPFIFSISSATPNDALWFAFVLVIPAFSW